MSALLGQWEGRPLTPTEREILALMADGFTAAEIARARHNSRSTIKTHRQHMFQKLQARNAPHAVALGFRLGILGS